MWIINIKTKELNGSPKIGLVQTFCENEETLRELVEIYENSPLVDSFFVQLTIMPSPKVDPMSANCNVNRFKKWIY